ncbi:MAG: AI-2E family transporter [Candidatus Avispirillum sp.]
MFKFKKNEKYASIAFYAVISVIICAAVIMCIFKFDTIRHYIKGFFAAIAPLTYGFVFAYLFNPIMNWYERTLFAFKKAKKDMHKLRRNLSLIMTVITILAVLSVILYAVIPQAIYSFENLGSQLNTYITNIQHFADDFVQNHSERFLGERYDSISKLLEEYGISLSIKDILSNSYSFLQSAFNYVIDYGGMIVNEVINVLLGLIVAVYFLIFKERICAQTKKLLCAILNRRAYLNTVRLARYTHKTFGGFIVGKLIDSVIIGLLTFFVLWIFKIPYYPLLAVIIGVTNIIPTFGPIFGGIFGALLLLIAAPDKVILFLIIVLVIQQLDGNIIGPKILGNTIGISSLWVVIAIFVFGSFFGFTGMIVGVPATAIIYVLVKQWSERRLRHKGYPYHTAYYASDPPTEPDSLDAGQVFIDRDTEIPEPSLDDDIPDPPEKEKVSLMKRISGFFKKRKSEKKNTK